MFHFLMFHPACDSTCLITIISFS